MRQINWAARKTLPPHQVFFSIHMIQLKRANTLTICIRMWSISLSIQSKSQHLSSRQLQQNPQSTAEFSANNNGFEWISLELLINFNTFCTFVFFFLKWKIKKIDTSIFWSYHSDIPPLIFLINGFSELSLKDSLKSIQFENSPWKF